MHSDVTTYILCTQSPFTLPLCKGLSFFPARFTPQKYQYIHKCNRENAATLASEKEKMPALENSVKLAL